MDAFRSTFCDWAAERAAYRREVVGMALAQAVGHKWRPPTIEAIFVRQAASTGGNVRPVLHDSEDAR